MQEEEAVCYLCYKTEETAECQSCNAIVPDSFLIDFSDAFDTAYDEGRTIIWSTWGYDYSDACADCIPDIREDIAIKRDQAVYDQMMEDHYMDQKESRRG